LLTPRARLWTLAAGDVLLVDNTAILQNRLACCGAGFGATTRQRRREATDDR
jgi:alpha-ketoglutarate-dependent taurine dioxygenase